MNKPYVYKRAEDLGIPIRDANSRIKITVTDDDVVLAKKADSKHCALARAALRLPGVKAAYFFRQIAFLEYRTKMLKFHLPESVTREIVTFDRAQIFDSGIYQMRPPPPSLSRQAIDNRNKQDKRDRKARKAASAVKSTAPGSGSKHIGSRTVTGIRKADAPAPLPGKAPTRYVHRTQYVRDLREPA